MLQDLEPGMLKKLTFCVLVFCLKTVCSSEVVFLIEGSLQVLTQYFLSMATALHSCTLSLGDSVRVGRRPSLELSINLPYLSGLHCAVDVRVYPNGRGHSCGVVDHSLNGTWWQRGGDSVKRAIKLKKGQRQEIQCGDHILLLSPCHKHCQEWRFVLERGGREGEFVFRQLPPEDCPPEVRGVKGASTAAAEISSTKTPRLDKHSSVTKKAGTAKSKAVKHTNKTVKPPKVSDGISPLDSIKVADLAATSTNKHTFVPSSLKDSSSVDLRPSPSHKLHTPTHSSADLTASPSHPHTSTPSSSHKPADIETMELEHCPKCLELFPVDQLPLHSEQCSAAIPHSQEVCPVCGKSFPVLYLVPHAAACRGNKEGDVVLGNSPKEETDSARRHALEPYEGSTSDLIGQSSHVTSAGGTAIAAESQSSSEQEHCQHCLGLFPLSELVAHSLSCLHRKQSQDSVTSGAGGEDVERCMHCFRDFPLSRIVNHSQMCQGDMLGPRGRFAAFLPSVHDMDPMALSVLNETQMAAVEYVMKRSKVESERVHSDLCKRVLSLGYTKRDLETTLQWVRRDAPIIVHLNLDSALRFLVNDTHYRNLFETGTGGGGTDKQARKIWEDRIFNKLYHSSPPVDRVKYGVLNIVGDPRGVQSCLGYGDSFLQLKKVRLRTTFASADTANDCVLSCCEYYGNVLNSYSSMELQAILQVATRKKPFLRSKMIANYKEVQIHGPLCLSENIDCIVVNDRHAHCKATRQLLDKFVEQNECNLVWMEAASEVGYPELALPATKKKKRSHHGYHAYDHGYHHGYDYDDDYGYDDDGYGESSDDNF